MWAFHYVCFCGAVVALEFLGEAFAVEVVEEAGGDEELAACFAVGGGVGVAGAGFWECGGGFEVGEAADFGGAEFEAGGAVGAAGVVVPGGSVWEGGGGGGR